jgi:hypothetical protein
VDISQCGLREISDNPLMTNAAHHRFSSSSPLCVVLCSLF